MREGDVEGALRLALIPELAGGDQTEQRVDRARAGLCVCEVKEAVAREGHVVAAQHEALDVGWRSAYSLWPPVLMSRCGPMRRRAAVRRSFEPSAKTDEVALDLAALHALMRGDEVGDGALRLQGTQRSPSRSCR